MRKSRAVIGFWLMHALGRPEMIDDAAGRSVRARPARRAARPRRRHLPAQRSRAGPGGHRRAPDDRQGRARSERLRARSPAARFATLRRCPMARWMSIRTLACGLALVVIAGAGTSQARRYAGVHVKGHTFHTGPDAADVQLRLVCPPQTQSTPRLGDFSFCAGKMVITRRGRSSPTARSRSARSTPISSTSRPPARAGARSSPASA